MLIIGCDRTSNETVSDLSFIQAKNALNQTQHQWIRTYFEPSKVAAHQQSEAHMISAEAWLSGHNQNLTTALMHISAANRITPNDPIIIKSLINNHFRSGNWEELETYLTHDIDPFVKAAIYIEYDPSKVLPILDSIPHEKHNMAFHELATKYFNSQNEHEKN